MGERIGGEPMSPPRSRPICEFCYKSLPATADGRLPEGWEFVWQSYVCPDCVKRVAFDGGYHFVPGGAYAQGPDPRDKALRRVIRRG